MNKKELEIITEKIYLEVRSLYKLKVKERIGPNKIDENEVYLIAFSVRNALEILFKKNKGRKKDK